VPTNPAAVPELDDLEGGRASPRGSAIRSSAPLRRDQMASEAAGEMWTDRSGRMVRAGSGPAWLLPALIAATCLAVGMVLGALLFQGSSPPSPPDAGPCVCPE
jgi:hypothetical protein